MIVIEDVGIIFYTKKSKDNCLVIKILSKNNNIITGFVFNALSKKNFCKNQIGNYVNFHYSKKNETELGIFDIDLINSNSEIFFQKKINIAIINSVIFFINFFLIENNNTNIIYKTLFNLIFSIKNTNNSYIIFCYIDFLFALFEYLGINFNPYICTVTGKKDTYYISPKTGNAVIKSIGDKYKNKLFIIPKCFKEFYFEKNDIINTFKIFYFFLQKFIQDNSLFYLEKEFNFLCQTMINIINNQNINKR